MTEQRPAMPGRNTATVRYTVPGEQKGRFSRRQFLKLAGTVAAGVVLTGCDALKVPELLPLSDFQTPDLTDRVGMAYPDKQDFMGGAITPSVYLKDGAWTDYNGNTYPADIVEKNVWDGRILRSGQDIGVNADGSYYFLGANEGLTTWRGNEFVRPTQPASRNLVEYGIIDKAPEGKEGLGDLSLRSVIIPREWVEKTSPVSE